MVLKVYALGVTVGLFYTIVWLVVVMRTNTKIEKINVELLTTIRSGNMSLILTPPPPLRESFSSPPVSSPPVSSPPVSSPPVSSPPVSSPPVIEEPIFHDCIV